MLKSSPMFPALLRDKKFDFSEEQRSRPFQPNLNLKQIGRPDGNPERPRMQISDGGNLHVFVLRRNGVATAITSSTGFGDGDHVEWQIHWWQLLPSNPRTLGLHSTFRRV
jgi:hypothetical protein